MALALAHPAGDIELEPSNATAPTDLGGSLSEVLVGEAHDRVRLTDFTVERTGKRCSGRVQVSWNGSGTFVGEAEDEDSHIGRLGCAARATAAALERAVGGRAVVAVDGVRTISGFETVLVAVAVSFSTETMDERVSGCAVVKGQPGRGAVLAVLSATNRLLARA